MVLGFTVEDCLSLFAMPVGDEIRLVKLHEMQVESLFLVDVKGWTFALITLRIRVDGRRRMNIVR